MEFLLIFMGLFFISAMFLGFDYIFEHTLFKEMEEVEESLS